MKDQIKFTIGLIINPISGMGGSVGLKGTDGRDILLDAIEMGAKPSAVDRTRELLIELKSIKANLKFIICLGIMGESLFLEKEFDFEYTCIKHPLFNKVEDILDTTANHTKIATGIIKNFDDLNLLLFVGGDGTARDIFNIIGKTVPCLGIPAGVKIYSSVFSLNPKVASSLILQFLLDEIPLKESVVLDINENEYRNGKLITSLYGYLLTPFSPQYMQLSKMGSPESDLDNQERIAKRIIESLKNDIYYLLGPGTTTKVIADKLNQPKTILGIDLCLNKKIIATDLNEKEILRYIKKSNAIIIISPIGKQGFIFGRGNLQFTPQVIKKVSSKNIIIISSKFKLQNIANQILRLDTRDSELDKNLRGLYKVYVDYDEIQICEVK